MAQVYKFTREGNKGAQELFRRAIEFDDQFALAHARLAYCMVLEMVYYEAEPSQAVLDEALRLVQRAVSLDDQEAFCHLAVARVRLARQEYALALLACSRGSASEDAIVLYGPDACTDCVDNPPEVQAGGEIAGAVNDAAAEATPGIVDRTTAEPGTAEPELWNRSGR